MKKNAKTLLASVIAFSQVMLLCLPCPAKLTVKSDKPGFLVFECDETDQVFLAMEDSEKLIWDVKMRGKAESFSLSVKNEESQISFDLRAAWGEGGELEFVLGEKSGTISWYVVTGFWEEWWGFAVTI